MLIDLTIQLENNLKMFDFFPPVIIEDYFDHESTKDRYSEPCQGSKVSRISTIDHIGTHVDAPVHFIPGGKDISQCSVDSIFGPAVYIDVSEKGEENPLSLNVFKKFQDQQNIKIKEGDIVIIKCTKKKWNDKGFMNSPSLLLDTAKYLVEKKVKAVGVDLMAVDCLDDMSRPVHLELLGHEVLAIEGLNNLEKIPTGRFTFIALPLFLKGASASPIRAIAVI